MKEAVMKKRLGLGVGVALLAVLLLLLSGVVDLADAELHLEPGDILFGHNEEPQYWEGIPIWYGYWGHVAIYVGDGKIVEATSYGYPDPEPGVILKDLTDFFGDERGYEDTAVKRLKDGDLWDQILEQYGGGEVITGNAVQYAKDQVRDPAIPFDWKFSKYDESAQYCSELVWHAYMVSGVDLDWNHDLFVSPDELYYSYKLKLVEETQDARTLTSLLTRGQNWLSFGWNVKNKAIDKLPKRTIIRSPTYEMTKTK
jgi:hypothetical protein